MRHERPDVVNHHAAQMSVVVSMSDPRLDAEINVLGSLNLLECARKFEVQNIVFISTGGAIYGDPQYLPCDEKHPIWPLSPYGATKRAFEMYLHMFQYNYGVDYTILRYPNVYGPRQNPFSEAGVVAIFTEKMLNGEEVVIFGEGKQERDFVYISDIVRANLLVMGR